MISGGANALCMPCADNLASDAQRDGTLGSGTRLRTRPSAIVLDGKDVAVKRRSPLLALHRYFEIRNT